MQGIAQVANGFAKTIWMSKNIFLIVPAHSGYEGG